MYFPVAGIELNPFVPVFVGAVASLIFGQVGLTGGIVTLPFMVSVLNFITPSVSATNLVYNIMTPFGSTYSYKREGRMLWRLGLIAGAGGVLGSVIGPRIRVGPLNDIILFKAFFGILLALIGLRLFIKRHADIKVGMVEKTSGTLWQQEFTFSGKSYSFSPIPVFLAGTVAGSLSTTFGIGTGFLLVPFYTTVLRLPIYAVASSALLSTLIISFAGTVVYSSLNTAVSTAPDLRLGILLGIGGVIGGFVSAKFQRRMSIMTLHKILGGALFLWAMVYLKQGF
jgi:uncharacterized membrane protein YfcA